jgi:hypothetical protein
MVSFPYGDIVRGAFVPGTARRGRCATKQSLHKQGDCFACSFAIAQDKARNDICARVNELRWLHPPSGDFTPFGALYPIRGTLPHSGHFTLSGTWVESQAELSPTLRSEGATRDALLPSPYTLRVRKQRGWSREESCNGAKPSTNFVHEYSNG